MALAMSSRTPHPSNLANPALDNNHVDQMQKETMPEEPLKTAPQPQIFAKNTPKKAIFPLSFKFSWEDIAFVARLTNDTKNNSLVTVTSHIGWLPFTAENSRQRGLALEFINQHTTPLTGKFTITIGGQVHFTQITEISCMESRREIIQALSICLLQARPYLKTVQNTLIPS